MKCLKNTETKNPKVARTKDGRIMLLSKCAISDSKKSKFIKQEEASGLLSSLGIKAPLCKISLLGPFFNSTAVNTKYKIKEIVNKFLLAGDKFMPEMHLRQLECTYSASGPCKYKNTKI